MYLALGAYANREEEGKGIITGKVTTSDGEPAIAQHANQWEAGVTMTRYVLR